MTFKVDVAVYQLFADGSHSIFREGQLDPANCLKLLSHMAFHHKDSPADTKSHISVLSLTNKQILIKYRRETLWSDYLTKVAETNNNSVANIYRFQPSTERDLFRAFDEIIMNVAAYVTLFPEIATPAISRHVASLAASKSFP